MRKIIFKQYKETNLDFPQQIEQKGLYKVVFIMLPDRCSMPIHILIINSLDNTENDCSTRKNSLKFNVLKKTQEVCYEPEIKKIHLNFLDLRNCEVLNLTFYGWMRLANIPI